MGTHKSLVYLHCFCKSTVVCVHLALLSQKVGIPRTDDLGIYLEMPLLYKRNYYYSKYQFIVEKTRRKLSSRKGKYLSMAACIILVQTSLNTIASYAMQTVKLPASTLNQITKICKDFI